MNKILIITKEVPYPPHRNGTTSSLYHFIECWKKMGLDITLMYLNEMEVEQQPLEDKFSITVNSLNTIGREFVTTVGEKWVIKPRNCWHINVSKCPIIDATSFDYIFLASFYGGMVADKILRNDNCKIIFYEADSLSMYYDRARAVKKSRFMKLYYLWQKNLIKRVENKLYNMSDMTYFVSDVDREYVEKNFHVSNVVACPIAVEIANHAKKNVDVDEEKDVLNIGFSGILNYEPNVLAVEYILNKIIPALDASNINYKMHIIGKNPREEWVSSPYVNNGKLVVTGFVEDIDSYISSLDIYISPLFLGAGMKNKVLQAMGIGVPMICSKVSTEGINELVSGKNCLVCGEEVVEWIDSIKKLKNSVSLRYTFSEECKTIIANNYSWDKSAKIVLDMD